MENVRKAQQPNITHELWIAVKKDKLEKFRGVIVGKFEHGWVWDNITKLLLIFLKSLRYWHDIGKFF